MSKAMKLGVLIEDTASGQFTKVINVRNGVYGLGGWGNRKQAEKQTVNTIHMNGRAIRNNAAFKVHTGKTAAMSAPAKAVVPEAPVTKASKPAKAKSTIAKPAVKKAAKRAQAAQKPAKKTARKSK